MAGIAFGFIVSGMTGTALYFSPAIAAAFQDFGHTIHHQAVAARRPAAGAKVMEPPSMKMLPP